MSDEQKESVEEILSNLRNWIVFGIIAGLFLAGITTGFITNVIYGTAILAGGIYEMVYYDLLGNEKPKPVPMAVSQSQNDCDGSDDRSLCIQMSRIADIMELSLTIEQRKDLATKLYMNYGVEPEGKEFWDYIKNEISCYPECDLVFPIDTSKSIKGTTSLNKTITWSVDQEYLQEFAKHCTDTGGELMGEFGCIWNRKGINNTVTPLCTDEQCDFRWEK